MGIYDESLPWLSKPRAVAEVTAALVTSAIAARADVASLDFGGGEEYWLPPGRRDVPWLVQERRVERAVRRARRQSCPGLRVSRSAAQRPADGHLRLRRLGLPRAAAARTWLDAVARGWDVVPVSSRTRSGSRASRMSRASRYRSATRERPHRARASLARRGADASLAQRGSSRAAARGARVPRSRAGRARHERPVRRRPRLRRVGRATEIEPMGAVRWIWVGSSRPQRRCGGRGLRSRTAAGRARRRAVVAAPTRRLDRTTVDFGDRHGDRHCHGAERRGSTSSRDIAPLTQLGATRITRVERGGSADRHVRGARRLPRRPCLAMPA